MKNTLLLISFCCFTSILYSQEFFIRRTGTVGSDEFNISVADKKIETDEDILLHYVTHRQPDTTKNFSQNREKWIKKVENEIITKELRETLNDTILLTEGVFVIIAHFDKKGEMFSPVFEMSEVIYERLPKDWVENTFRYLAKEKIIASDFWNFKKSQSNELGRIYLSVIDLLKGEDRNQDETYKKFKKETSAEYRKTKSDQKRYNK